MGGCDILLAGTGSLAEAALFAFATLDSGGELRLTIAGRNRARCRWLSLAANARAAAFSLPNYTDEAIIDWRTPEAIAETLGRLAPKVIVQTASMQSPWALGERNAWSAMIAEGGYGLATPFHTILTSRMVRAVELAKAESVVINGAYPDIANSIIKCMGLKPPIGFGNVDIVATSVAAALGTRTPGQVRMLAQWEPHVAAFREPPEKRNSASPKVWIDGKPVEDFMERFRHIKFPSPGTDDSLNQITGSVVVPMAAAFVRGTTYRGHAAGPFGLPGGYPVKIEGGTVALDLPDGLSEAEAVAYNKFFEEHEGVVLDEAAQRILLVGKAREVLAKHDPELAAGYMVDSLEALEATCRRLEALRNKLIARPAA